MRFARAGNPRWLWLALLVALSGCAHQWTRPGATPQQRYQALASCSEQAEQKFPVRNELAVYGGYTVAYGFCNEMMMACFPGDPVRFMVPQISSQVVDINERSRAQALDQCMRRDGWQ